VIASLAGTGGYAERAIASADQLVEIPLELGTREAVALLADGRTALLLARAAAIQAGELVLVEAAAGGVGSLLVQLAAKAQAQVVGAAGGARKLDVARELGANVVVDYAQPGWPDRLGQELGKLDVVFDGVGGAVGRAAFDLLRPGGRFVPFGMSSGSFAPVDDAEAERRQIRLIRLGRPTPGEMRAVVQSALAEAVAGRLRPLIGQTFALEQAAAAHAAIEQRSTVGKTLLLVGEAFS
jgi:NADPH2:quinone reductase